MTADRVDVLFSDYDGTLSPLDATRSRSEVAPALASALRRIAGSASFAVITSKPYDFIYERLPYADAWGCISGLDIRFKGGSRMAVSSPADVQGAFETARRIAPADVTFEEKRDDSRMLGFSVDWRRASSAPDVPALVSAMSGYGLAPYYDPDYPFADFLCAPSRKGGALVCIREVCAPEGATLFLGDSPADNSAFREADVSVGVSHGQSLSRLECDFLTTPQDIVTFLSALSDNGMLFHDGLPGVTRRR
jgi:hypothetical protein